MPRTTPKARRAHFSIALSVARRPRGAGPGVPGPGGGMATLNVAWRSAVVGVCFALFGLGGMILSLIVFPLLRLAPRGRAVSERRARVVVRGSFLALLAVLQALRIVRIAKRNLAALQATWPAPELA